MEDRKYIIHVGPNGTFKPRGKHHSTQIEVDKVFEDYESRKLKNLTLYFHGGLVNEKSGIKTAENIHANLNSANHGVLCLVWETGLFETLRDNIQTVSKTRLFKKLIKILTKNLTKKLGISLSDSRGSGKSLSEEMLEKELTSETPFEDFEVFDFGTNSRGADAEFKIPQTPEELELELRFEVESDYEIPGLLQENQIALEEDKNSRGFISTAILVRYLAKIAFRVIKRFVARRDHGFYPTIIEELMREIYLAEIGSSIWNSMKIKSDQMWYPNEGLHGTDQHVGRYVLEKLVKLKNAQPDLSINLVGHSAGSIVTCNLLKTSTQSFPDLKFKSIVFLAPACRVELFHSEIVQKPNFFSKLLIYTMYDSIEKKDLLLPYVYTRSLLYLISGVLENEGNDSDALVLGMERHISGIRPYDTIAEAVATNRFLYGQSNRRLVYSITGEHELEGQRSSSTTHGGFDEDENTLESLKFILNQP
ncbi:hypothetical protein ACFSKL_02905 [Belliella marina]|uniref:Alpha/beta hydrolase n=1 Tax=Belliella marina TaxID=1644146 RepID=A0ABW4VLR9_9BACT